MKSIRSRRRRKQESGIVFVLASVLLLVLIMSALSAYTLSDYLTVHNNDSAQKAQATELAEAGANDLYAQIAAYGDSATTTTGMPTSISSKNINGVAGSTGDGCYTASVLATSVNAAGTVTTVVIQGNGTAPNGTTKASVTLECTMTQSAGSGGSGTLTVASGGIVAGGAVTVSGNSHLVDLNGNHTAGVVCNGAVSVTGSGTIDGPCQSNGAVTVSGGSTWIYGSTIANGAVSVNGSGAIDGSVSALGSVAVSSGTIGGAVTATGAVTNSWGSIGGTITQNDTGLTLSTTTTVPTAPLGGTLDTAWKTAAQAGTTTNNPWPSGWASSAYSATGPIYYSGNISTGAGMSYSISPPAGATTPSIMYINGNLSISGGSTITNNGVIIIVTGTISIDGGTTYNVPASKLASSALISLSSSTNAISLSGGSTTGVGLIWAANGGASVSGGSTYKGAVVAASTVNLSGGSTIGYTSGFAGTVNVGVPSSGPTGTFTTSSANSYFRSL
ncbi:MAG: hypothetical protein P4L33_03635 [Capsulimonadaceae bacterium]|nr:hypothetical protein [Capsulimonadaceae bacterium]